FEFATEINAGIDTAGGPLSSLLAEYTLNERFNHPPLMGLWSLVALHVSDGLHLPFAHVFKLLPMAADVAALFALLRVTPRPGALPRATARCPAGLCVLPPRHARAGSVRRAARCRGPLLLRARHRLHLLFAPLGRAFLRRPAAALPAQRDRRRRRRARPRRRV